MTYMPPTRNLQRKPLKTSSNRLAPALSKVSHEDRIMHQLRILDVSRFGLRTMESRYLPRIIHSGEQLGGVVYGHHEAGFAMLVATDSRIIFLDKKPLIVNEEEISYEVVSGVSFSHAGFGSTVTLHTRIKDYAIRTFNQKSAQRFVDYIEFRCLEHNYEREGYYDQPA